MTIPLNKPTLVGGEFKFIRDAIRRGQLSGDGYYTHQCSRFLERYLSSPRVLLTSSCTHALELAFLVMDIKPGDEVILPSFTFTSTANAFVLRGAIPRFVDVRPDTLNMDETLIEKAITRRTRAIVPVHYAGVPCQMDVIMRIARKHRLIVIEDSAQALGASFRGQRAGTFGRMNAFSFHETKNCICGEGGALTLSKPADIRRAEIIRQKGTDREQYLRGEVDKYSWKDVGSSYPPSELQAAYLYAQLGHLEGIRKHRKLIFDRYGEALAPYVKKGNLQTSTIPADVESSYHIFFILLRDEAQRQKVQAALKRKDIISVFHYFPLHLSTMGRGYGYSKGDFPVSEYAAARLLRLPIYNSMPWKDQKRVIQALKAAL
jgi:dTDP-4-amino-4,6-dideoxygalactose transaminase